MRNLRLGVLTLAVLFSLSLMANLFFVCRLERVRSPLQGIMRMAEHPSIPPADARPFNTDYVEGVGGLSQQLLMNQSLIQFAGGEKFGRASSEERALLIRQWCMTNLPGQFSALAASDRSRLVDSLQSGLEDLLEEKEFRA